MDRFLATLNKLQDVFTTAGVSTKEIDLPQIVVVGSQSTGKSSVLENIAKQNFLPRGMGIVTRRPLVLQMIQVPSKKVISGKTCNTWAQFLHKGDTLYTSMSAIQQEIIDDTNRVCGMNKGIKDDPIHLKLYSTKIPSLTLVDLPGLTKIPVGDQPRDIDQKIERQVRSFIVKENSIILAVSAGNVDIANSDSLKLAREVDPTGSRTIAVITKCDLMENNEESNALLNGTSVDVKLGLIGVINRNNKQLAEKTPIDKILAIEEDYFLSNYPGIADRMGTEYLTSQLCDILIIHYFCIVRAHLVDMIPKIVMKYFVRKLCSELNSILIKSLYTEEKITELVQESDRVVRKRKASSKMMKVLLEAEKLVTDIAVGRNVH